LDGHSFAPRLFDKSVPVRQWAYAEAKGKYWVRNRHWKLYNDGRFYAVAADPLETRPLDMQALTDPAEAAYKKLRAALQTVKSFD